MGWVAGGVFTLGSSGVALGSVGHEGLFLFRCVGTVFLFACRHSTNFIPGFAPCEGAVFHHVCSHGLAINNCIARPVVYSREVNPVMNAPETSARQPAILRKIRMALAFFMVALVLSGITAFPLESELQKFIAIRGLENVAPAQAPTGFDRWILNVGDGLRDSYAKYPWLAYGTDWLAFAHIVIAIFFIGAFMDPVRNIWILKAGIIGCVLVIPLALICGAIRQIPFGWRMIDCSFGVFGVIPLLYSLRLTRALENKTG